MPERLIDTHTHVHASVTHDRMRAILDERAKTGVEVTGVAAMEQDPDRHGNDWVSQVAKLEPDRVFGWAMVRLGRDDASIVNRVRDMGLGGLKIIRPTRNYDDDSFFPVYARAEELRMPILFHSGLVSPRAWDKELGTSSARMHPMYLDRVARQFPDLVFIIAHMGVPWFETGTHLSFIHKNVYTDAAGQIFPMRRPETWRDCFWDWDWFKDQPMISKLVFATDLSFEISGWTLNDSLRMYDTVLDALNASDQARHRIYAGNACRIMGRE